MQNASSSKLVQIHSHKLVVGERYIIEIIDTGLETIRDNCLEISDVIGVLCTNTANCGDYHRIDGERVIHTVVARFASINYVRSNSLFRSGTSTLAFTDLSLYNTLSERGNPIMFRPRRDIILRSESVRCFNVPGPPILVRGMFYIDLMVHFSKIRKLKARRHAPRMIRDDVHADAGA